VNTILLWIEDRLRLRPFIELLSKKTVPQHKHSFWYLFGGLALLFFLIQLVTGVLLLMYYSPTPATAHESVQFIMNQVPYGWLVRSVHSWSAHLMVACVMIHFFSTFLMKAYRKPRELMWMSGVVLLLLVLGFAFTGYLLPWDTTAYFATQIGTEIPRSLPIIGELMVKVLRGGEFIAEESLKRLFALHVVILPIISLALIAFHLILNQVHGTSVPLGITPRKPSMPFFPNYIFRDLIAWTIAIIALFCIVLIFPVQLQLKADPLVSAPLGIRPEWYFLPLYQTLRMLPSTILGMNSEVVVNMLVGILGAVAFFIPFIDRKASREEQSHLMTVSGIAAIVYMIFSITLAYLV
jgi:cytochrome b6